jgi:hypothetical protein
VSMNLQNQMGPERLTTHVFGGFLQRKCDCGQHTIAGGQCSECSQKSASNLQRSVIRRQFANEHHTVPPIVHEALNSLVQPLETRAVMRPTFTHDFSRVKVETETFDARSLHFAKKMVIGPMDGVAEFKEKDSDVGTPAQKPPGTPQAAAPKKKAASILL